MIYSFSQTVIQSEAKNLGNIHFMYSRFFAPLHYALNDNDGIHQFVSLKE